MSPANAVMNAIDILLVEDSDTDALLIREALADVTEFEPALVRAERLADGLARAESARFDVVLLDLGLPDAQGLDTVRTFMRLSHNVPVLVLTGLDDVSVGLPAIQEGAQDFLQKNALHASELGRAIRYAIERHRIAAELRASREELQRLSANIQRVREEEKNRIARELHDDLGQLLVALKMEAARVDDYVSGIEPAPPVAGMRNIDALIDQLVDSVRRIAADLRPTMLDDLGLLPAIDWLVERFSANHDIAVIRRIGMHDVEFNREGSTAVFRIVQEALTNVARHSGATSVTLDIARKGSDCVVHVADNGRGCAGAERASPDAFGLLGMRERAARLGGAVHISTAPGQGFALTVALPLAAIEDAGPA